MVGAIAKAIAAEWHHHTLEWQSEEHVKEGDADYGKGKAHAQWVKRGDVHLRKTEWEKMRSSMVHTTNCLVDVVFGLKNYLEDKTHGCLRDASSDRNVDWGGRGRRAHACSAAVPAVRPWLVARCARRAARQLRSRAARQLRSRAALSRRALGRRTPGTHPALRASSLTRSLPTLSLSLRVRVPTCGRGPLVQAWM